MQANDYVKGKQHAFDCYCKKILRNEARTHYAAQKRRRERELSVESLPPNQMLTLCSWDRYFQNEMIFQAHGAEVIILNRKLAAALEQLPEELRTILPMSYCLRWSDIEISKCLSLHRRTVSRRRKAALRELREKVTLYDCA